MGSVFIVSCYGCFYHPPQNFRISAVIFGVVTIKGTHVIERNDRKGTKCNGVDGG